MATGKVGTFSSDFHRAVALACIQQYELLPSKGKPQDGQQWTPLAGVVQRNSDSKLKVVALGTGSKCIGKKALNHHGKYFLLYTVKPPIVNTSYGPRLFVFLSVFLH